MDNSLVFVDRVLVVASGMWKPNIPDIKGIEMADGYETMSLNPDDYEGKTVLILGRTAPPPLFLCVNLY